MYTKTHNKVIYQDTKITQFLVESPKYGNQYVIVNTSDYEEVRNYRWALRYRKKEKRIGAVATHIKGNKSILPHRLIMKDCPELYVIDHVDRDVLNNTRNNLRFASYVENGRNSRKSSLNTSGYKGVSFDKNKKRFRAYIKIGNQNKSIGRYKTAREAAEAYNAVAVKY